jgi:hypothetical protein
MEMIENLDFQPNNILVDLPDLDRLVSAFLQSQNGGEESAEVRTLILPNGEEY